MRRRISLGVLAATAVLASCADTPVSAPPAAEVAGPAYTRTGTYGGREYALYTTEEEARNSAGLAEVFSMPISVRWTGNAVRGWAQMSYYGTHASLTTTLSARNAVEAQSVTGQAEDAPTIPWWHTLAGDPIQVQLRGEQTCGGVATLTAQALAKVNVLIEIPILRLTELSRRARTATGNASQEACQPEPCPQTGADGTVNSDGMLCYEDRTQRGDGSGGGGDGCETCLQEPPTGPTWCKVRYKYWLDTGEIFSMTVLYCW